MAIRAAELEVVVTADTSAAQSKLDQFQKGLGGQIGNIVGGGILHRVGEEWLGFAKDFVMAGAEFGMTMTYVDRLAGDTGQYIDQLTAKALQMGQQTIYSAQEAALGMEQLAREGFSAQQIFSGGAQGEGLIQDVLNFAAAVDIAVPQAANIFGNTFRVFQDQGLGATEVVDILTQSILRSGRSPAEFATGLQYVGASADALGVPLQDVTTYVSYLEAHMVQARNAGTSLRTFFVNLADPTDEASALLEQLNVHAYDLNGNFVGMDNIIGQLHTAYAGLTDQQKEADTAILFGKYAMSGMLELISGGPEAMDKFRNSEAELGSAQDIMSARLDNLWGSVHKLTSSWFTLKKTMGDSVAGGIKPIIDGLVELVNLMIVAPDAVQAAAASFIILSGALMTVVGALKLLTATGMLPVLVGFLPELIALAAAIGLVTYAWHKGSDELKQDIEPAWRKIRFTVHDFFHDIQSGNYGQAFDQLFTRTFGNVKWKLAITDFFHDLGQGNIGEAFDQFTKRISQNVIIDGVVSFVGDLFTIATSGLWSFIKTKLGFSDQVANNQPGSQAYMAGDLSTHTSAQEVSFGDVLVRGGVLLVGLLGDIAHGIGEGIGGLYGWVKREITGKGLGPVGDGTDISGGDLPPINLRLGGTIKFLGDLLNFSLNPIPWIRSHLSNNSDGGHDNTTMFGLQGQSHQLDWNNFSINIKAPDGSDIHVDTSGIVAAVHAAMIKNLDPFPDDPASNTAARAAGERRGRTFVDNFIDGVAGLLDSGRGGNHGNKASTGGLPSVKSDVLDNAVIGFAKGMFLEISDRTEKVLTDQFGPGGDTGLFQGQKGNSLHEKFWNGLVNMFFTQPVNLANYVLDNPFHGWADTISGWLDEQERDLLSWLDKVPSWMTKLASGDLFGAIKDVVSGNSAATWNDNPSTLAGGQGGDAWTLAHFFPNGLNLGGTGKESGMPPAMPGGYWDQGVWVQTAGGQGQSSWTQNHLGTYFPTPLGVGPAPIMHQPQAGTQTPGGSSGFASGAGGDVAVTTLPDVGSGPVALSAQGFGQLAAIGKQAAAASLAVKGAMAQIKGSLATAGSAAAPFAAAIQAGMQRAQAAVKSSVAAIIALLPGFAAQMQAGGAHAATAFVSALEAARGRAHSAGIGLVQSAVSGLSNGYGEAYSQGIQIGVGFSAGISAMQGMAYLAGLGLAAAATAGSAGHLIIKSPSKLYEHYGRMSGQGFINGLNASARDVANVARNMVATGAPVPAGAVAGGGDTYVLQGVFGRDADRYIRRQAEKGGHRVAARQSMAQQLRSGGW